MTPREATLHRTALLESALQYAQRGWAVFPVHSVLDGRCSCGRRPCEPDNGNAGKHPRTEHGLLDASTDLDMIRRWWARWPDANIGTPTTWASVVDCDPRHGGDDTLTRLLAEHGALPETPEVLTGGGGRHLYFKPVPGLRNSAGRIGPGVDVRADGGYVLLPPSTHVSGGLYCEELSRPLFETPLAEMPGWLVTLASRSSPTGPGPAPPVDEAIPAGQRNQTLTSLAGTMRRRGLAVEEILAALRAVNTRRCVPPLSDLEVERIAVSVGRYTPEDDPPAPTREDGLGLVRVGALLDEPDELRPWVVHNRLPAGGLGLLVAKPKVGKTTLARGLAVKVARGDLWLGQATTAGPVIYLALEEKRSEVRAHFRTLGARRDDPIYILCAAAPTDALARLRREVERRHPVLIIVDPLFRFVRVPDGNDYATMTAALEPLLTLARETGACLLLVHHLGKGERLGADAILGSTAIFGAVDTVLLMRRAEAYRTLETVQRYGESLDELTLQWDPVTRTVEAGASRAEADLATAQQVILAFLDRAPGPVTEPELADGIDLRTALQRVALRKLVATGGVTRTGGGTKGQPFRYAGTRNPEAATP